MKINLYRSLPVWGALFFGLMFATSPMSHAQSTGDCRDAAGAPIRCTPTPRPTDAPAQATALPTNTPEPTAIPLIALPTTGSCVASPIGTTRVNIRNTPSTQGNILESILVNSTVPVVGRVKLEDGDWVITPSGFILASALRFGGDNCAKLAKIIPPSSTGPFILRQDVDGDGVDDTQYMKVTFQDILISSATDAQPDDDGVGFWPENSSAVARLMAGAVEDEDGDPTLACTNVKLHNPYNPSNPTNACLDIGDITGTFVVCFKVGSGEHCMVGETTNQEVLDQWELMTRIAVPVDTSAAAHVKVFDGRDGTLAVSPTFPLVFVPSSPARDDGSTSGDTSVCIDPTDEIYGEPSGGCILFGSTLIAWCVGDWCLYHEY